MSSVEHYPVCPSQPCSYGTLCGILSSIGYVPRLPHDLFGGNFLVWTRTHEGSSQIDRLYIYPPTFKLFGSEQPVWPMQAIALKLTEEEAQRTRLSEDRSEGSAKALFFSLIKLLAAFAKHLKRRKGVAKKTGRPKSQKRAKVPLKRGQGH